MLSPSWLYRLLGFQNIGALFGGTMLDRRNLFSARLNPRFIVIDSRRHCSHSLPELLGRIDICDMETGVSGDDSRYRA